MAAAVRQSEATYHLAGSIQLRPGLGRQRRRPRRSHNGGGLVRAGELVRPFGTASSSATSATATCSIAVTSRAQSDRRPSLM
jgi:hypothetical protein